MLPFYSSRLFKLQNAGLPSEITQWGAAMTPFFSVRVYLCVKRGNEAKWKQSVAWNRCQKLEHRGFFSFDHIFATGGFFWSHSQRICLSETPLNKRKKKQFTSSSAPGEGNEYVCRHSAFLIDLLYNNKGTFQPLAYVSLPFHVLPLQGFWVWLIHS